MYGCAVVRSSSGAGKHRLCRRLDLSIWCTVNTSTHDTHCNSTQHALCASGALAVISLKRVVTVFLCCLRRRVNRC